MVTFAQYAKGIRRRKHHKTKVPAMKKKPQRQGIIMRVLTMKPKNLIVHKGKFVR
jgi:ribosomal protein S12